MIEVFVWENESYMKSRKKVHFFLLHFENFQILFSTLDCLSKEVSSANSYNHCLEKVLK